MTVALSKSTKTDGDGSMGLIGFAVASEEIEEPSRLEEAIFNDLIESSKQVEWPQESDTFLSV
mgnify:CR=1 FL=1